MCSKEKEPSLDHSSCQGHQLLKEKTILRISRIE